MPTPQPLPAPLAYRASEVDDSDKLSQMRSAHPRYVYAHYWTAWTYAETRPDGKPVPGEDFGKGLGVGCFVPSIHKIYVRKGLQGAQTDADIEAPIAAAQRKGATIIRPGDQRLGPWCDYLRIYRDKSGGIHYVEQTERAVRLPSGETVLRPDEAAYHRFLLHLRDSGIVDPMSPLAYEQLRTRLEAELEYLREAATRTGSSPQLERKARLLVAVDQAWEAEQQRQAEQADGYASLPLEVAVVDEADEAQPQQELTAAELALREAAARRPAPKGRK